MKRQQSMPWGKDDPKAYALHLALSGRDAADIASLMGIDVETVERYLSGVEPKVPGAALNFVMSSAIQDYQRMDKYEQQGERTKLLRLVLDASKVMGAAEGNAAPLPPLPEGLTL